MNNKPVGWMRIASWLKRHKTGLSIASALLLAAVGFFALHRMLLEVHPRDVRAAFHALGAGRIVAALSLTAASYLLLTLYDVLALRIIGKPLPYRTAALASFTSYTLSHNLGLALLTGGSARYRIYSANGLGPGDIVRVIASASLGFWSAITVMTAAALVVHPAEFAIGPVSVTIMAQRVAGLSVLCLACFVLAQPAKSGRTLRLSGWTMPLPSSRQAILQMLVAGLDLAAASAALYVLAPGATAPLFPLFFLGYALAMIVSLVTHVPGGIGVFEAVMIGALPQLHKPELLAALIAYRAIYYLLPLLLAALLLAVHEHRHWKRPLAAALDVSQSIASAVAPMLLSALAFTGGALLLVSGSLPAIPHRLQLLRHIVPLPFVEASHIAASLAGTALLLLAPGLFKRLDGAFILARTMLVAGALFSLTKGFDFEEAAILLLIAGILHWTRSAFYRHTALTMHSFSAQWIAMIGVALGLALWIGIFSFKHVAYQSDLWWQFAWKGDASRFLRASFATAVLVLGAILVRFFRPAEQAQATDPCQAPGDPRKLSGNDRTDAMLALTGDKRFLVSESGKAFLMFQVQGYSWIVMGDPVGPREEWPDLLWRIRERADAAQGRLLLYQLSTKALPLAVDLGLQLVKYGEEARVDLAHFTIEGSNARALRQATRRAEREGATFEVVPSGQVSAIIPELSAVSATWLLSKGQSEKTFSVGHFDPAYLAQFDCAVVRLNGRIVAFANIWATPGRQELSVDLMRHGDIVPYGVMDFLFVRLMEWGKQLGFSWFTLGIAPLSGIETRKLAPMWARAGALLYRHGETFYGFEGLRAYKDKFSPCWEPRYIAGPHGLGLARALIDLQTLVGGGRGSAARRRSLALAA